MTIYLSHDCFARADRKSTTGHRIAGDASLLHGWLRHTIGE
ncbi:hypothetical protein ACFPVT_03160 [Corynebacterium choanae]|nr:hypothetical protein [Corynebacterium choanae]